MALKSKDKSRLLNALDAAEVLFKFAYAISPLILTKLPELPYPEVFTWGKHTAKRSELKLTALEEKRATAILEHAATYLCAVQVDKTLTVLYPQGHNSKDPTIRSACRIAGFVRNSFAHNPFAPTWNVGQKKERFSIPDVIDLDTTSLHGKSVRQRHYGGPLAILRLLQFTKEQVHKT